MILDWSYLYFAKSGNNNKNSFCAMVITHYESRLFHKVRQNLLTLDTSFWSCFLFIQYTGWADVGFHNPHVITPTIDSLAREGVVLDQSYVHLLCTPYDLIFTLPWLLWILINMWLAFIVYYYFLLEEVSHFFKELCTQFSFPVWD